MKKNSVRKLTLNSQTVALLTQQQLADVAGGAISVDVPDTCPKSYCYCPTKARCWSNDTAC